MFEADIYCRADCYIEINFKKKANRYTNTQRLAVCHANEQRKWHYLLMMHFSVVDYFFHSLPGNTDTSVRLNKIRYHINSSKLKGIEI